MTNILVTAAMMTNIMLGSGEQWIFTNAVCGISTGCVNELSLAWNFVAEAKHLTKEERDYFNSAATASDAMRGMIGYGGASVRVIAEEVRALDVLRELQILATNSIPKTNTVQWIGHPVISDGASYIPSEGYIPSVQIGLRSDGVVVWRKK